MILLLKSKDDERLDIEKKMDDEDA